MAKSLWGRRALWTLHRVLSIGAFLFLSACGDGAPTGLDASALEVLLVGGDGQAADPGAKLPLPFRVRVQAKGNGAAAEGVRVRWEVLEGQGTSLDPDVSVVDSLGLAETRLTLGSALGTYRIRASVNGLESPPLEFSARAILLPVFTQSPAHPVAPGDSILLGGENFSLDPGQNVVTFSGVRGRVVSASTAELMVEVPNCLLARDYEVRVRIGSLTTAPRPLVVSGGAEPLVLDPGEDRVLDASTGFGCFFLPFEPSASYLAVPVSTSTVSGAEHAFSFSTLNGAGVPGEAGSPVVGGATPWHAPAPGGGVRADEAAQLEPVLEIQDRWDEKLRLMEADLITNSMGLSESWSAEAPVPHAPPPLPGLGDRRRFDVLNINEKFDRVTARVRYISEHTLVYMDENVPSGGFTDSELVALAEEFEDPVYSTITRSFGSESDLDQNERVIILFTSAVNRLTPPGSDGFVGGFFYGLDLLAGRASSNEGEIFYAMVPDPSGEEGTPIPRYTALNTIPAVFAHEFEHMVHFNQRILSGKAEAPEALWLSEALAQMAEDLVGTVFEMAHEPSKAHRYRVGNWIRAKRFLQNPSQVSVLASLPPGTLAERGAGWLLLKQVLGRMSQEGLLADLASSTQSGVENLTSVVGVSWDGLVVDWAGALFLDGVSLPVRSELQVPGVDLRNVLLESGGSYPLQPLTLGEGSPPFSGTLWSSAPNYFIISPSAGGVTVNASGPLGGPAEPALGLKVLLVRLF